MYKQLIIAHPWLSDQATIASTSEQGSLPASNLLRSPYATDWWRSQGSPGEIHLDIHLPEIDGLSWDLVAPLYTNSSAAATWQILTAGTHGGLDSPTFEDVVRPMWTVPDAMRPGAPEWRHAFRWLKGNARSEPWLRIIINDPAPIVPADVVAPFVQWGRLYIALAWQPSYHHDKGSELMPANEKGRRVTTQGGGDRVGATARPRAFKFNVGFLGRDEMLTRGYELDRLVGTTGDLLIIDAPEDAVHVDKGMIYGTLPSASGLQHVDTDTYAKSYVLQEMQS